ncbi:TetR/AcrR family transcriptional regulator [soil metagenome]
MRYSKDHKAETHDRIVKNASVRLRERGAASLGVAELMKEAGLTHGGFYAHFASRDALISEAFAHAMQQTTGRWRKRAEQVPEGKRLASIVNGYLSTEHRDDIGNGCALPSLGIEVSRASPKTRKAFANKLDDMIAMLVEQSPNLPAKTARRDAIAVISTIMGAMILARAAGASDFSDEILSAGRYAALRGEEAAKPRTRKPKVKTEA